MCCVHILRMLYFALCSCSLVRSFVLFSIASQLLSLLCRSKIKVLSKLFQTCNMEIIRLAQQMFNFVLPSELIAKRANKFLPGSCML